MKIYLARHGETNYNVLGLHNADPTVNVHLTEKGIEDAKQLAKKLAGIKFDAVYVSEMPRTTQTASFITNLTPIIDKRLNDIDSGFEGQSVHDYHIARDNSPDPYLFKVDGHESSEDAYKRTADFLQELKTKNYENILIITSLHNLRHFRSIIDGIAPREGLKFHFNNADYIMREI